MANTFAFAESRGGALRRVAFEAVSAARVGVQGKTFPDKFLWGRATAGHQVEGNNTNSDMWTQEHLPGSIFKEPSGDACDLRHLCD